ncbi:MAG: PaaI family thioesterase [Paracoccus sp. BP8]|uniref:PaaI family thioesterase n=1 Tax=Paracoccus sp. J39 TaxID=935848 RepID=UPI0004ADBD4F|nr:PaaI family thioesterase [Paracoccus sp. J39]RQP04168.1 MAG: PaaI family thioesterase [Paracoccus sp. BP8]
MPTLLYPDSAPFVDHLRFEILSHEGHEAVVRMPADHIYKNRKGDVHGGAISALLDHSLGLAACGTGPNARISSTLSITIQYLNRGSGELICRTSVQRAGRSIIYLQGMVKGADGNPVAVGMATFKLFGTPPAES